MKIKNVKMNFINFLLVLCLSELCYGQECPSQCVCQGTVVKCLKQHLDHIPHPLPKYITMLDLRYNRIQEVPPNIFQDLGALHTIFLNENQIQKLHEDSFSGIPSLRFLFLNKNHISKLPDNIFRPLQQIQNLNLQANNIDDFHPDVFSNLPKLERIFLNDNKIKKIPNGAFENLPSLNRLRLDGNKIMCDCGLMPFLKLMKMKRTTVSITAFCNEPSKYSGKNLNSVIMTEMECEKPQIVSQTTDTTVPLGQSKILHCNATGEPKPKITWIKNDHIILYNNQYQQLKDGSLLIPTFSPLDVGTYRCIATNDMGVAESKSIELNHNSNHNDNHNHNEDDSSSQSSDSNSNNINNNIHDANNNINNNNKIKVILLQKSIQLNEDITLNCIVDGALKKRITYSWYLNDDHVQLENGGFNNQLKIFANGTLMITNLNVDNLGVYKCRAIDKTSAATIENEIEINIEETPTIVLSPENQTIKVGDDIILQCEAEGYPLPKMTWLKNGDVIETTNRVFYALENSELHIEYSKESDSGLYTCVAENALGSVYAESNVVVKRIFTAPKFEYEPYDDEVLPGTTIEIPCQPEGEISYETRWQKDGRTILQTPRIRLSTSGSLFITNITVEDEGRYECSIINEYGRSTASGFITVRKDHLLAPGDRYVHIAFAEATKDIDNAINQTVASLFSGKPRHHGDLYRLFNFPNAPTRELARAAEVYERTLTNIKAHVERGDTIKANVTEFNYRDILSANHLELIAKLSGCNAHRITPNCTNICYHRKYRSVDGSCNNLENPTWGASLTGFRRLLPPIYENGFSMPIGWTKGKLYNGFEKPSARLISTSLITTEEITPDTRITHMMMQWGQFLDHDLDHALPAVSSESWDGLDCKKSCEYAAPCYPIQVPPNDPRVTNRRCIDFVRSSAICGSGVTSVFFDTIQPREQVNQLTSYIDASQVYGYTEEFARDLRDQILDDGTLREGVHFPNQKAMLPFASPADGIDCRRDLDESNINCFVAGDIRVNEQVGLLSMHIIWFREHNRIARELLEINPHWSGDIIYNEARKIVGAQNQHITYKHWLPNILGAKGMEMLGEYKGYDATVNPSISNEFATAALRFGHSLINPILHRFDENFEEIKQGHLPLGKAFFAPWRVVYEGGVDPLMRGLFTMPAKLKMPQQNMNNELTEKLFKTAHAVALDLAAMNVQRSRDHAIPGYNEYRRICNLSYAETFDDLKKEITSEAVRNKLKEIYGHPSNIDIFVGGILEDQVDGAKIGPLFRCLLIEQFRRLRTGDRFWYENKEIFKPEQLQEIYKTNFARVLCDNGDNITKITEDVFILPKHQGGYKSCDKMPSIDLRKWVDCSECANTCSRNSQLERVRRSTRSVGGRSKRELVHDTLYSNQTLFDDSPYHNQIEYDMNDERIEGLESLVERFEKSLKQIRRKLKKIEQSCPVDSKNSINKPNKHGHCIDDKGIRRLNNEVWDKDECTKCECVHHSQINCTREKCPELLNCKKDNVTKKKGECCAACKTKLSSPKSTVKAYTTAPSAAFTTVPSATN